MPTVESTSTNSTSGGLDTIVATVTVGVYLFRIDLRNFANPDVVRVWATLDGGTPAVINTVEVTAPYDDGSAGAPQMLEIGPLVTTATSGAGSIFLSIEQTVGSGVAYAWQLVKVV